MLELCDRVLYCLVAYLTIFLCQQYIVSVIGWVFYVMRLADANWQGKQEYSEDNPPHYHIIHYKSRMKWPRIELGQPRREAGD
jgi:hypothetical protein